MSANSQQEPAFAEANAELMAQRAALRQRIRLPALALMLAGGSSCLPLLLPLIWALDWYDATHGARLHQFRIPTEQILFFLSGVAGALILMGAVLMFRLEWYRGAIFGSILALFPVHTFWVLGFPFGIWALWVLRKPEARAAFAR